VKRYGTWIALGVLCIGSIGTAASCSWNPFEPPTYGEAEHGHAGSGSGGTAGVGPGTGGISGGSLCGNALLEINESCDDGNQTDGDGCGSTCQSEECWACSGGGCQPTSPNTSCNNGAQVCDGKGGCGDCVPADMVCDNCKSCGGSICNQGSDCASNACVTDICRSMSGSLCADPVECDSNHCQGGVCTKCDKSTQCNSFSCDSATGQCMAAIGEPCDSYMPCALGLVCDPIKICKGSEGVYCTGDYQCTSNKCVNNSCITCTANIDCFPQGACSNGACSPVPLPEGAYCINSSDCASSNCTGFPRRCTPP
jgi:hypothetical protein